MKKPLPKFSLKTTLRQKKGQLVVEYVLLIFIAVVIATLLTQRLVGRGDNQGVIITAWSRMLEMVGSDLGD